MLRGEVSLYLDSVYNRDRSIERHNAACRMDAVRDSAVSSCLASALLLLDSGSNAVMRRLRFCLLHGWQFSTPRAYISESAQVWVQSPISQQKQTQQPRLCWFNPLILLHRADIIGLSRREFFVIFNREFIVLMELHYCSHIPPWNRGFLCRGNVEKVESFFADHVICRCFCSNFDNVTVPFTITTSTVPDLHVLVRNIGNGADFKDKIDDPLQYHPSIPDLGALVSCHKVFQHTKPLRAR